MADTIPQVEQLKQNLGKISYTLDKAYFQRLHDDFSVLPYDEKYNIEKVKDEHGCEQTVEINSYVSNIRALRIKRLIYDKDEKFSDCFQNAVSIFANSGNAVAFVFNRFADRTEAYAVVRNSGQGQNEYSKANIAALKQSLLGNFQGSDFDVIDEKHQGEDTKKVFFDGEKDLLPSIKSIAAICNIPSPKSEEYLSQNLEKLLNGYIPSADGEWYSIVVLAESLATSQIRNIKEGLEELTSSISPFQQHQFQAGESSAKTTGEMKSLSRSESTSRAISKTHSVNVGINGSRTKSHSIGLSLFHNVVSLGAQKGKQKGASSGYGYSWGKTETKGTVDTESHGENNSITLGESESTTYTYQSYTVKNIIGALEQELSRVQLGESVGFWRYATFVCAPNAKISKNVANFIRAITQGASSYTEPSTVAIWNEENVNGTSDFDEIKKYIFNFSHPVFVNNADGTPVNFSADINTLEFANAVPFPRHSIQGLPVTTCASFGREPHALTSIKCDVEMGKAYHMLNIEKERSVAISKGNLTAHTLITGSTGSGKSNTIYHLLESLCPENSNETHFLVVEPAKGEYKKVLGNREDVSVYGTNPRLSELLRINPFSFPPEIHIYEHMDRLIEIFNVCWPMYAAMPAVLKDAVEQAYKNAGWDLRTSTNKYCPNLFPSFVDVLSEIENVMNASQYSADSKGDYKGALCTRLKSLTNGINSLIFCADELSSKKLFDENVIIDLSRIGSTETKSLIMGLLVMKLQEHRMAHPKMNNKLNHITVLEEAHNILKRTSTEQSSESSNMVGKSVEMLTNAIAEMRTYGEGFVIADQAPGLLDEAVIRNTNTKIILRLPEYSDRKLVGKAIGLNDVQIDELARLEKGVAAIYQNDWMEAVLCKIEEYPVDKNTQYNFSGKILTPNSVKDSLISHYLKRDLYHLIDTVDDSVVKADLPVKSKCLLFDYTDADEHQKYKLAAGIAYEAFGGAEIISQITPEMDFSEKKRCLSLRLNEELAPLPLADQSFILNLIVIWHSQITESAEIRILAERLIEQSRLEGIK